MEDDHLFTQFKQLKQILNRSHYKVEEESDQQEKWLTVESNSATCTFIFDMRGNFIRMELDANFYSE